jgi:hypothetical protein
MVIPRFLLRRSGVGVNRSGSLMTNFDLNALLTQDHYAWPFRIMLGDIHDFLKFSEHNIEWQLLVERQSIQRRTLDSFGFDDNNLAQSYKDNLLESAAHRFTVALYRPD